MRIPPRRRRTLVLRSTHSSQLSVGLLRFCFFLGGVAPFTRVAIAWAMGPGSMAACSVLRVVASPDRVASMWNGPEGVAPLERVGPSSMRLRGGWRRTASDLGSRVKAISGSKPGTRGVRFV